MAELDEEYEPNDNPPLPLKTKVKPLSEIPVGWIMQSDPTSGLPCFVNRSSGAKVKILFIFYKTTYSIF